MNKYFVIKQGMIINLDKVCYISYKEEQLCKNKYIDFYFSDTHYLRVWDRDVGGNEVVQQIYEQLIQKLGV